MESVENGPPQEAITEAAIELPRVSPIGLVEFPDRYVASPRRIPVILRVVAVLLLAAFAAAGTATTVASFGAYCLTSYASLPGASPASRSGATSSRAGHPPHRNHPRQERHTSPQKGNF